MEDQLIHLYQVFRQGEQTAEVKDRRDAAWMMIKLNAIEGGVG